MKSRRRNWRKWSGRRRKKKQEEEQGEMRYRWKIRKRTTGNFSAAKD